MRRHLDTTSALLEILGEEAPRTFFAVSEPLLSGNRTHDNASRSAPRPLGQCRHRDRRDRRRRRAGGRRQRSRAHARRAIRWRSAAVEAGAPIRKFGQIIGFASRPIAAGEWVHEHNCAVKEFARDYHFGEDARRETIVPVDEPANLSGLSTRERQSRDAQLSRDPDFGELLGDRRATDREGGRTLRNSLPTTRMSTA